MEIKVIRTMTNTRITKCILFEKKTMDRLYDDLIYNQLNFCKQSKNHF